MKRITGDVIESKMGEMVGIVCDKLCRYPREATDQEALEDICINCPISEHVTWFLNHAEAKRQQDIPEWKERIMERFQKVE